MTNTDFVVYDTATGRILYSGNVPDTLLVEQELAVGHSLLPVKADGFNEYILEGGVAVKTPFSYSVSVIGLIATLTGLPSGVTVDVSDQSILTDGGVTEIEVDVAGTYTVRLFHSAPHFDETLEVAIG